MIKNKKPENIEKQEVRETNYRKLFLRIIEDAEFTNIDKITSILAYFSTSNFNVEQNINETKIIELPNYNHQGKNINVRVEIKPNQDYGLPTTGDLTFWIAFLQIVYGKFYDGKTIHQPITFKHNELLNIARHKSKSVLAYNLITEWLLRMQGTQLFLHGKFVENKKKEQILATSLFSDIKIFGNIDENGREIKDNFVWLSDYMLRRLLEDPPLIVNFETYTKIKNQTAKLLMVHLQIWLYASGGSVFQKSYADLCNLLRIKIHTAQWKIKKQLKPAFDDLVELDYVASWRIEKMADGQTFKIVIIPGKKYLEDNKKINEIFNFKGVETLDLQLKSAAQTDGFSVRQNELFERLLELGIYETPARRIVEKFETEILARRIDWAVGEMKKAQENTLIKSEGAFLKNLIESKTIIPQNYNADQNSQSRSLPGGFQKEIDDEMVEEEYAKETELEKSYEDFCFAEGEKQYQPFLLFSAEFGEGEKIYEKLYKKIQSKIIKPTFDSWFASSKYAGFDSQNKILKIAANEVTINWIRTYYQPMIDESLSQLDLNSYQIEWIICNADMSSIESRENFFYRLNAINIYQKSEKAIDFDEWILSKTTKVSG